jgi:hypothetical protein
MYLAAEAAGAHSNLVSHAGAVLDLVRSCHVEVWEGAFIRMTDVFVQLGYGEGLLSACSGVRSWAIRSYSQLGKCCHGRLRFASNPNSE